jgi:hypothetical protein
MQGQRRCGGRILRDEEDRSSRIRCFCAAEFLDFRSGYAVEIRSALAVE